MGAFCTICRARPVGTGLGAKLGRKPAKNQIKIVIVLLILSEGKLAVEDYSERRDGAFQVCPRFALLCKPSGSTLVANGPSVVAKLKRGCTVRALIQKPLRSGQGP